MMFKTIISVSFCVALLANSSAASKSKCEYSEVMLKTGTCDGTCEDPRPACLFAKILKDRCGCAPGTVRNVNNNCVKIYRCPNRDSMVITQCQHEAMLNNQIKCTEDGLYEKNQLVDGVGKCVVPETGATIPGKADVNGGKQDCEDLSLCQQEYIDMIMFHYNNVDVMDGPNVQCNSNGFYKRRQCTSFTTNCQCVVPKTGKTIPGLGFVGAKYRCREANYTKCQEEFIKAELHNLRSENHKIPVPECSIIDGKYPASSCDSLGNCHCLNRETGKALPGSGPNIQCRTLTACQKQYTAGLEDDQIKSCDHDGRFITKSCNDEFCECLDADTGIPIEGTDKVPVSEAYDFKCPEPSCPSNMKYSDCARACPRTCDNKDQVQMCTMMCHFRCECPANTVWSKIHNKCVADDECDEVPPPILGPEPPVVGPEPPMPPIPKVPSDIQFPSVPSDPVDIPPPLGLDP